MDELDAVRERRETLGREGQRVAIAVETDVPEQRETAGGTPRRGRRGRGWRRRAPRRAGRGQGRAARSCDRGRQGCAEGRRAWRSRFVPLGPDPHPLRPVSGEVEAGCAAEGRARGAQKSPAITSPSASENPASAVGGVGLPGGGIPDLGAGARADDGEVAVEAGVLAQHRRDGHAELLVRDLLRGSAEEHAQVVAAGLAELRGLLRHPLVERLELALAVHVDAALLAAGHDETGGEVVPELRGKDDAALVVEFGDERAEQHRHHPLLSGQMKGGSTILHFPPPASINHRHCVPICGDTRKTP